MRLTRKTTLASAAAMLLLGLTACAPAGSAGPGGIDDEGDAPSTATGNGPYNLEIAENPEFEAGTTMAEIAEAGTLRVGTKFDQPLFGLQGPDGTPVGFDVAIAALIAAELGIAFEDIEWTEAQSAVRESFLESDQVDIVVATYTINDARKERIDFAGPYFIAGQDIIVQAGNPEGITGPEDLAGLPVCSAEGSTPAATIADEYGAELLAAGGYSDCLDPLRNGQVVAVTTDNVILSGFVDQNPGEFELLGETFTEEPYGIGLPLGDDAFRTFINDVLEEAFANGTWARLYEETAGTVLEVPEPPMVDRY
ncbi:amino acid ABC transporter substrate-binding protein (PAAT family) [Microcella putealis]|uniref:Amino acid ABC transporter substrate-binding protein (PAAT family) n=1 Tax=Microcella putealis TaxID=337005 RepID=A0A4Q7LS76_9MICO|nr:glutamate ABC transporter substrate-binding protein [Microcella putealis]RZS57676.1 amino acid ABC transporter substrate-binding protein (PAAT family) [Microcella putealis]TQM24743.1 amino acid ABC transporter substrate-binding protein (PAAT family) [Microcella putealis]